MPSTGGEGDTDAAVTLLGLFAGAAIAHNFNLAASPKGMTDFGAWAVGIGLAVALTIGYLMRERR